MNKPIKGIAKVLTANGSLFLWVIVIFFLIFSFPGIENFSDLFHADSTVKDKATVFIFGSILALGLIKLLGLYLTGSENVGQKTNSESQLYHESELRDLRAIRRNADNLLSDIAVAQQRAVDFKFTPTEEERAQLVAEAQKSLERSMRDGVLNEFESRYAPKILAKNNQDAIRDLFIDCRERLLLEVGALGRRGNLNLIFGVLATCLALGVLAWISFILTSQSETIAWGELTTLYLPRIALAGFVQVFAFFFLRLYKSTLQEIKYFQNEITSIDMRMIALENTMYLEDNALTKEICIILAKTDRNLGNGSPTVVMEKGSNVNDRLISLAEELLKKATR